MLQPASNAELSWVLERLRRELPDGIFHATPILVKENRSWREKWGVNVEIPEAGLFFVRNGLERLKHVFVAEKNHPPKMIGSYIPLDILLGIYSGDEVPLANDELVGDRLYYESLNLLQDLSEIGRNADLTDHVLLERLPVSDRVKRLYRVSDLVEADMLALR